MIDILISKRTNLFRHAAVWLASAAALFALTHAASAQEAEATPDAVAVFNEAQDLHEKGDLTGAMRVYDRALEIEPRFPEAAYQKGMAQLALGQSAEAESSFRRAVEIRPDWTLAKTVLASVLVARGEIAESERLLTEVLKTEPQNQAALAAMVDVRLRTNAPTDALKELLSRTTVLTGKANPTASIWSARAAIELRLGDKASAKKSVENAIAIDPNNRPALFQAAELALDAGDIERAKYAMNSLERGRAAGEPLLLLRANILASEGNAAEALKLLASIPDPSPAAVEAQAGISSRIADTPVDLEKRLADDPKNAAILGRLCTLLRRDDPLKAAGYCRQASEIEPANIHHAIGYAAALVQAKQYEGAVTILRKIIETAPDNWTAHANLATALFQMKRFAEAKQEYIWLTAKQPKLPAAYFFLAIAFDELREYADAMANYQQYLKIADPVENKLDIERVNLRLPSLQRLLNEGKGKKRSGG